MAPEIGKRAYAKLDDKGGSLPEFAQRKQRNLLQRYIFTTINTIILALLLATSALALIWTRSNFRNGRWHPQTMVPRISVAPKTFHLTDTYMGYTEKSNEAWDDLVPIQHGLIRLEDPYKYDLQPGHADPEDADVAWFAISVFHQLHCLSAIRDTLRALKTDQPARIWGGSNHLEHCLDYIRQGLMCAADTTIEWPAFVKTGFIDDGPITGEGIAHQCRDWDAVLKFGIENGALKSNVGLNLSRVIE